MTMVLWSEVIGIGISGLNRQSALDGTVGSEICFATSRYEECIRAQFSMDVPALCCKQLAAKARTWVKQRHPQDICTCRLMSETKQVLVGSHRFGK